MALTERQRKYLRGLAHGLKPTIHIGVSGVSPALLAELERTLEHHELVKIRVRVGDRARRERTIAEILQRTGAELLSRVGNVAVVYRPHLAEPKISLPDATQT